ncbi:xanthine dehydrogenase family protein molybdopterin-binding subunit [Nonomuraea sp. NPDC048916]|uniref:xanthine dehydrogenase family protein molybdopterin-binding subunit n=1 Tax=Nonomuraea sp. NPDC048916 TaxID=3154232 RepID=UPI0034113779
MNQPPDTQASDARARVTGRLPFVLNERVPGMLHAALVRSSVPHAEIRAVDTGAAAALPGVVAVLTAEDLAVNGDPLMFGDARQDQPVLAHDRVRYVGDPVAIVLAETRRLAIEACSLVDVDYVDLPHVVDPREATSDAASLVHEAQAGNVLATWTLRHGDADAAMAGADRHYDDTYLSPPASHVPMEPHVALAQWTGDGVVILTSTQAPHVVKETVARTLRLPEEQVRVRCRDVGGAYGAKVVTTIEPVVAAAARAVGRPVRLELSRSEEFHTVCKHAARIRIRTGVRDDGRIVARIVDVLWNAGAYATNSADAAGYGMVRAPGPYHVPNVSVTSTTAYTNTVPSGPFRGAMTSQLCWAYESQIDDIAADLGIDPVEIRRINLLREGDRYPTGEIMEDLHYDEILDAVTSGLAALPPAPPVRSGHVRGTGVALVIKSTQTPSRSECLIRLDAAGGVELLIASVEIGQGAHETLRTLAAEALGVPQSGVRVHLPDTAVAPYDSLTASSRTTFAMGSAVQDAAAQLREKLRGLAAAMSGTDPSRLRNAPGGFTDPGGSRCTYEEILRHSGLDSCEAHGRWVSTGGLGSLDSNGQGSASTHWHQGGVAVEVDVELETGKVRVLRAHGACFSGRTVSPIRVRQQTDGGMIFGLGPALFEELLYEDGQITNPNLSDYMIPSMLDMPPILGGSAIEGPRGGRRELHGVGESTVPPMAPAIGNAIRAACGIRIRELPMTPERVLRALYEEAGA